MEKINFRITNYTKIRDKSIEIECRYLDAKVLSLINDRYYYIFYNINNHVRGRKLKNLLHEDFTEI